MIQARPLVQSGPMPADALPLAGGGLWFREVEVLTRGGPSRFAAASTLPDDLVDRLTRPRAPIGAMALNQPRIMGILNVTPDSFSDGGRNQGDAALSHARQMRDHGADILDIGGESTRPGATPVTLEEERARVLPALDAIRADGIDLPISIDTRKAAIARETMARDPRTRGANLFNDVSALTHDPASPDAARELGVPVCLMHAQGDPQTMQQAPHYDDVLLDVYDWLDRRIRELEAHGLDRNLMLVDPGIGFGKTHDHNLALIRGLSLFHGLGCAILFGASRKRFIGTLTGEQIAARRDPGSHAVMIEAARQGAQILRVHDTKGAVQALRVWSALNLPTFQDDTTTSERHPR